MRFALAAELLFLVAAPPGAPAVAPDCACCKPQCFCGQGKKDKDCLCYPCKCQADHYLGRQTRLDIGGLFYDVQPDGSLKPCAACNANAKPAKPEKMTVEQLNAHVKDEGTGTLYVGIAPANPAGEYAVVDKLEGFAPGVYLCYCRKGTPVMCLVLPAAPAPIRLAPGGCPTCPTCPRR